MPESVKLPHDLKVLEVSGDIWRRDKIGNGLQVKTNDALPEGTILVGGDVPSTLTPVDEKGKQHRLSIGGPPGTLPAWEKV